MQRITETSMLDFLKGPQYIPEPFMSLDEKGMEVSKVIQNRGNNEENG